LGIRDEEGDILRAAFENAGSDKNLTIILMSTANLPGKLASKGRVLFVPEIRSE
jgi:hypothetical protein